MRATLLLVVACLFAVSAGAQTPALTIFSSNAAKAVVQALTPQLEAATGRRLQVTFENSADLKTRIEKGEAFDAAILTQALIDELAASGKLVASSRAAVARAGVGVAVKKGAPVPDVSTPAALKQAIERAKSITYVGQGATAPILKKMFADFGLTEAVNAKTTLVLNAGDAVAAGEAELGFTQISEILNIPGATLAGPLPAALQVYTSFGAAVSANARDAAAAATIIRVLTSQAAAAVITAKGMQPAAAPDRLPPIPVSLMTDAQKKAAEEFKVIRNGAEVSGPFFPLLRSPELMVRASAMGEYLRYRSSLPPRLSEFVILLTAREWTQQYEWNAHYTIALKAGVSLPIATAIAEGRRPDGMDADQETLYDLVQDLLKTKNVSDPVYQRALAKFGEPGVVDTVGIVGYYSMLAMVLNTARTPGGDSTAPVLQPLKK